MTKTRDLYSVLGIKRTATPKQVRTAYRKLALKLHPDRGGDAAQFQAVTEAHDVLSDPDRRARYDATGETHQPHENQAVVEMMSILSPCLIAALNQIAESGREVAHEHVVERMRAILKDGVLKLAKAVKEHEKLRLSVLATVDRFTIHDGEENLLASAAKGHLIGIDGQLANLRGQLERVNKAMEYLKKCGFKVEPIVSKSFANMYMPTYSTATWGTC